MGGHKGREDGCTKEVGWTQRLVFGEGEWAQGMVFVQKHLETHGQSVKITYHHMIVVVIE